MISEKSMARLEAHLSPIGGEDTVAQAGRKILLQNFVKIAQNEEGSRAGEDIEFVHDMRVATRRTRSAVRVFDPYLKGKALAPYTKAIRKTARRLGRVRDLDVMIADLTAYQAELEGAPAEAIKSIIELLIVKRDNAREKLVSWFDSKKYRDFSKKYAQFLLDDGKGVVEPDSLIEPHQVRHVAPLMIYDALAAVRAYDVVIADADFETLHALRVAFKRLRYTIDSFKDVLGTTATAYIDEIKAMQDYLGRLNDVVVAHERLEELGKLTAEQIAARDAYLAKLEQEANERVTNFIQEAWEPFNKRVVQSKLSNAILALR
ncbi:CHAD domain-containing protein [Phototrophicus methaneseepsis]|uniref:CHAD domain-containing protein n=1 Tax=Phototrophicus methaneseepsis TaxID=2710758 RepID=A0A7S8E7K8_9CHLR|nr:CHAD domain-containing protein [Phototrophicus methaneseepsis]QPC81850.1 CHAD domain-containing protein [Phototrophicus methaneseepsis]